MKSLKGIFAIAQKKRQLINVNKNVKNVLWKVIIRIYAPNAIMKMVIIN